MRNQYPFLFVLCCLILGSLWAGSCDQKTINTTDKNTSPARQGKFADIEHIVVIVKENRTFDTYFGAYTPTSGQFVNGTTMGTAGDMTFPLPRGKDVGPYVLHELDHTLSSWNEGAMDGFHLPGVMKGYGPPSSDPAREAFVQYTREDLPNYWRLADRFVLADNYYTSIMSSTLPNRLHSIAAQSAGVYEGALATQWNCGLGVALAPVLLEDCTKGFAEVCFDIPIITDLLEQDGYTWKTYVTPRDGDGWFNPFFAIRSIWDKAQESEEWAEEHFPPLDQIIEDAKNDRLPHVSFLLHPLETSEHPPEGTVCCGENSTAEHIWSIMESPAWDNTLIVLTWNDYGGYYDHAPPPGVNEVCEGSEIYRPGFRVPALFISPYVEPGKISHTQYEHASVLRGIEDIFELTGTLHALDPRANDHNVQSIVDVLNMDAPNTAIPDRTARTCSSGCALGDSEWRKFGK